MRTSRSLTLLTPSILALLGLLACGGSSSSGPGAEVPASTATVLSYSNPAGTGWRLVRDASASTATRVVLSLVGPSGLATRGVGFNIQAAPGVKFSAFEDGLPIADTGVYELRALHSEDPGEPVALIGGVKAGNILSAGIYQKDRALDAKDSGVALCQIAIQLDPGAGLSKGAAIPLTVLKAKVIPQDIGSTADDAWTLSRKMRMADITIAVGALSAQ